MYKQIDLTNIGGYPLSQEDLAHLQSSYVDAFAALAGMVGNKVIITGMLEAAGSVTAGWISINNELVPFLAGAIGTGEYSIVETITPLTFHDGSNNEVLITRIAQFSVGGDQQYAELVRIGTLKNDMPKIGDIKMVHCDNTYIAANFDGTGLGINERVGWAICNGINETVDMGDMFPMAYKNGVREMGDTGGSKEVTLASNQQGTFTVQTSRDDISGGSASVTASLKFNGNEAPTNGGSNQSSFGTALTVNLSAAAIPIDKMNPFKTLLFIQKIA